MTYLARPCAKAESYVWIRDEECVERSPELVKYIILISIRLLSVRFCRFRRFRTLYQHAGISDVIVTLAPARYSHVPETVPDRHVLIGRQPTAFEWKPFHSTVFTTAVAGSVSSSVPEWRGENAVVDCTRWLFLIRKNECTKDVFDYFGSQVKEKTPLLHSKISSIIYLWKKNTSLWNQCITLTEFGLKKCVHR